MAGGLGADESEVTESPDADEASGGRVMAIEAVKAVADSCKEVTCMEAWRNPWDSLEELLLLFFRLGVAELVLSLSFSMAGGGFSVVCVVKAVVVFARAEQRLVCGAAELKSKYCSGVARLKGCRGRVRVRGWVRVLGFGVLKGWEVQVQLKTCHDHADFKACSFFSTCDG